MQYVYLAIIIVLIIYVYYLNTPTGKGRTLENKINNTNKKLAERLGGLEFRDLMFKDDFSSSQIDNLLLTTKGLYVMEAKNYNGHIFGSEHQEKWTMTVKHTNTKRARSGRTYKTTHISKHSFYNPLKQNQTHINKIVKLMEIHQNIPIYNIVVFGQNAVLRDVSHSSNVFVIKSNQISRTIIELEQRAEREINHEIMMDFVDMLIFHNIEDKKMRKQHVQHIKSKYQKK
ncbi:MAG: nuclease-related domain-containing protein [Acholeplasmataceae bacterium]